MAAKTSIQSSYVEQRSVSAAIAAVAYTEDELKKITGVKADHIQRLLCATKSLGGEDTALDELVKYTHCIFVTSLCKTPMEINVLHTQNARLYMACQCGHLTEVQELAAKEAEINWHRPSPDIDQKLRNIFNFVKLN